LKKIF
jgi:hypothetical protein